jgi:hypothetical protein
MSEACREDRTHDEEEEVPRPQGHTKMFSLLSIRLLKLKLPLRKIQMKFSSDRKSRRCFFFLGLKESVNLYFE